MGLTKDEFSAAIGDTVVAVRGTSGAVHATWTLAIDGTEQDSATAAGDFRLRGRLPDGSEVEASVHQSLVGPTRVVIVHEGNEILNGEGFVA